MKKVSSLSEQAQGVAPLLEIAPARPSFLSRALSFALYAIIALVPLWFLPFTQDMLAYQKQTLLVLLAGAGLIFWLAQAISRNELSWRSSPAAYAALGGVALSVAASTLFSSWTYGSFWGFPINPADSFLTAFSFITFFILLVNAVRESKNLAIPYLLLILSGSAAVVLTALQLLGVFLIPLQVARVSTFNTVGTESAVAMLAAVMIPLVLALFATSSRVIVKIAYGTLVFALMSALALLGATKAWLALIVGLLVVIAFGMWNARQRATTRWLALPMAFLVVALFFVVVSPNIPGVRVPAEVAPSAVSEVAIAVASMRTHPVVGSGPGMFALEYARLHSPLLNQTVFWGTRFSTGFSELLDWIVTKGPLGLLTLLLLIGVVLWKGVRYLKREESMEEGGAWMVGLGTFAALVTTVVSLALYPANIVMWMFFWTLLASLVVIAEREVKIVALPSTSFASLGVVFLFLLTLISQFVLIFIGGQKYAADVAYARGVVAFKQDGDVDKAGDRVFAATKLNPSMDVYWRDLAQLYIAKLNVLNNNASLSDDEKKQQMQTAVNNAATAARQAVIAAEGNVANWHVQGFVFQNLLSVGVGGTYDTAVQSYERAVALEPASPFAHTELGRVYLANAQLLSATKDGKERAQAEFEKSESSLQKALELKSDYAPAHFLLAVLYDKQGRVAEAGNKLEEIKRANPNDEGIAFQLGVVYWQKGDLSRAQAELERAKSLNVQYMNARYMLGLVYDKQGKTEKALAEFRAILQNNPNNSEVASIIANLEAGKPALTGLAPAQPPIAETPPEISGKEAGKTPSVPAKKSPKK